MTSPKPFDWLSEAEHAIAAAVEKHGQCALLYSGGIESSLLLHLAAPRRDRISVYTVRTGAEFPHMMDFIDRTLRDWEHRVITVNLGASFGELGLPASAVPIEHVPGIASTININERLPRIVPWPFCCARNRWQPGCEAIKADGIGAVIHGQRAGDYPRHTPTPLEYPGLELVAPLWSASRATTIDRIATMAEAELQCWIRDRKNRRQIPHRMEECGYVRVRNEAAKDGLWVINGKRQVIYARSNLSIRDRIDAAGKLVDQ